MNTSPEIGRTRWAIPEGYIPAYGFGPAPEFVSHEAFCVLNATHQDAHIVMMIFFEHRDPAGPYEFLVPARRAKHFRFNDLTDPEKIPLATTYASYFESDVPIVIQHTRLDSRQAENALMTTMAFPG